MTRIQSLNPYKITCKMMAAGNQYGAQVNSRISREDYALLTSVSPDAGTIQTTVGVLVKSVVDALKQNGINEYNPTALIHILTEMRARALEVSITERLEGNEYGRTTGVCEGRSQTPR